MNNPWEVQAATTNYPGQIQMFDPNQFQGVGQPLNTTTQAQPGAPQSKPFSSGQDGEYSHPQQQLGAPQHAQSQPFSSGQDGGYLQPQQQENNWNQGWAQQGWNTQQNDELNTPQINNWNPQAFTSDQGLQQANFEDFTQGQGYQGFSDGAGTYNSWQQQGDLQYPGQGQAQDGWQQPALFGAAVQEAFQQNQDSQQYPNPGVVMAASNGPVMHNDQGAASEEHNRQEPLIVDDDDSSGMGGFFHRDDADEVIYNPISQNQAANHDIRVEQHSPTEKTEPQSAMFNSNSFSNLDVEPSPFDLIQGDSNALQPPGLGIPGISPIKHEDLEKVKFIVGGSGSSSANQSASHSPQVCDQSGASEPNTPGYKPRDSPAAGTGRPPTHQRTNSGASTVSHHSQQSSLMDSQELSHEVLRTLSPQSSASQASGKSPSVFSGPYERSNSVQSGHSVESMGSLNQSQGPPMSSGSMGSSPAANPFRKGLSPAVGQRHSPAVTPSNYNQGTPSPQVFAPNFPETGDAPSTGTPNPITTPVEAQPSQVATRLDHGAHQLDIYATPIEPKPTSAFHPVGSPTSSPESPFPIATASGHNGIRPEMEGITPLKDINSSTGVGTPHGKQHNDEDIPSFTQSMAYKFHQQRAENNLSPATTLWENPEVTMPGLHLAPLQGDQQSPNQQKSVNLDSSFSPNPQTSMQYPSDHQEQYHQTTPHATSPLQINTQRDGHSNLSFQQQLTGPQSPKLLQQQQPQQNLTQSSPVGTSQQQIFTSFSPQGDASHQQHQHQRPHLPTQYGTGTPQAPSQTPVERQQAQQPHDLAKQITQYGSGTPQSPTQLPVEHQQPQKPHDPPAQYATSSPQAPTQTPVEHQQQPHQTHLPAQYVTGSPQAPTQTPIQHQQQPHQPHLPAQHVTGSPQAPTQTPTQHQQQPHQPHLPAQYVTSSPQSPTQTPIEHPHHQQQQASVQQPSPRSPEQQLQAHIPAQHGTSFPQTPTQTPVEHPQQQQQQAFVQQQSSPRSPGQQLQARQQQPVSQSTAQQHSQQSLAQSQTHQNSVPQSPTQQHQPQQAASTMPTQEPFQQHQFSQQPVSPVQQHIGSGPQSPAQQYFEQQQAQQQSAAQSPAQQYPQPFSPIEQQPYSQQHIPQNVQQPPGDLQNQSVKQQARPEPQQMPENQQRSNSRSSSLSTSSHSDKQQQQQPHNSSNAQLENDTIKGSFIPNVQYQPGISDGFLHSPPQQAPPVPASQQQGMTPNTSNALVTNDIVVTQPISNVVEPVSGQNMQNLNQANIQSNMTNLGLPAVQHPRTSSPIVQQPALANQPQPDQAAQVGAPTQPPASQGIQQPGTVDGGQGQRLGQQYITSQAPVQATTAQPQVQSSQAAPPQVSSQPSQMMPAHPPSGYMQPASFPSPNPAPHQPTTVVQQPQPTQLQQNSITGQQSMSNTQVIPHPQPPPTSNNQQIVTPTGNVPNSGNHSVETNPPANKPITRQSRKESTDSISSEIRLARENDAGPPVSMSSAPDSQPTGVDSRMTRREHDPRDPPDPRYHDSRSRDPRYDQRDPRYQYDPHYAYDRDRQYDPRYSYDYQYSYGYPPPDPRYDPYYNYRPPSRGYYEDPYRPRSRTGYEEGPYERPRSRQGQYPEDAQKYHQRQGHPEDPQRHGSRPSSRTGYPAEPPRPSSRSGYADNPARPSSRSGYVDQPARPSSRSGRPDEHPAPRTHAEYEYERARHDYYRQTSRDYYDYYNSQYYAGSHYDQHMQYPADKFSSGYQAEMQYYQQGSQNSSRYEYGSSYTDYDRSSVHSMSSRGSTPGLEYNSHADHFAQEFYGSRPGSRQSVNYEQSTIYPPQDASYPNHYEQSYSEPPSHTQEYIPPEPKRSTPEQYSFPHACVRFGPAGQIIQVLPNNPREGQPATVIIQDMNSFLGYTDLVEDELKSFPGPLVKGDTHKNDVLTFCQQQAVKCRSNPSIIDVESAELLWKYLELLIKQNGTVVGTDLADLLLDGHEPSSAAFAKTGVPIVPSEADFLEESTLNVTVDRSVIRTEQTVDELTDRFRHLLLHGRKKDALEWAMKRQLWGHALFLANKIDHKTHAIVMTRFANCAMKMNDPLQTLYQQMSGRQPAAVTLVTDEKWGDWRPHLAMILSNDSSRPELHNRSISALGDTLASKHYLHASHFCYLMAQIQFGIYTKKSSKIVLIGSSHSLPFVDFATNLAIQCTEVYEYAMSLGKAPFRLHTIQMYKYLYAIRLADAGLGEEALHYCEILAGALQQSPGSYSATLVKLVLDLAGRLKYLDPERQHASDDEGDPVWLTGLEKLVQAYNEGGIQSALGNDTPLGFSSTTASSEVGEILGQSVVPTAHQMEQPTSHQVEQPVSHQGEQLGFTNMTQAHYEADHTQQGLFYPQPSQMFDPNQQMEADSQSLDTNSTNYQQEAPPAWDHGQGHQTWDQGQGHQTWDQSQMANQQSALWDQNAYDGSYLGYTAQNQDAVDGQDPNFAQPQQHQQPQDQDQMPNGDINLGASMNSNYSTNTGGTLTDAESDGKVNSAQPGGNDYFGLSTQSADTPQSFTGNGPLFADGTPAHRASFSPQTSPDSAWGSPNSPPLSPNSSPRTPSSRASLSPKKTLSPSTPAKNTDIFQFGVPPPNTPFMSSGASTALGASATDVSQQEESRRRQKYPGEESGDEASQTKTTSRQKKQMPQKQPSFFKRMFGFGGKSSNEMKLPDDKNPSIVWDDKNQRWMNTDGDEDVPQAAPPPPRDTDLGTAAPPAVYKQQPVPAGPIAATPSGPPPPPSANKYSLQKGRGARSQYVDVLSGKTKSAHAPSGLFNVLPKSASMPAKLFVPGMLDDGVGDGEALSNHQEPHSQAEQNPSNGLPAPSEVEESKSRPEVPVQTRPVQTQPASAAMGPPSQGPPIMFNPAQFNQSQVTSQPGPSGPSRGMRYGQRRAYPR